LDFWSPRFCAFACGAKVRLAECLACKTDWRIDQIEKSVNELFKKVSRPGFSAERDDDDLARKDATQLCIIKHALVVPKNDGNTAEYVPLKPYPAWFIRESAIDVSAMGWCRSAPQFRST